MAPFAENDTSRDIARLVLAAYTAVTAIAVIPTIAERGAPSGTGQAMPLAVAHLLLLIAIVFSFRARGGAWTPFADWLPLLAVPLLYAELPMVIRVVGGMLGTARGSYHDALIQHWDGALFGSQPSRTLAGRLPFAPLSELLHAAYLSYYLIIYLPPLWLYLVADRRTFHQAVLALTLTFIACLVTSACFPVEGPRYEWGAPPGEPSGIFRAAAIHILQVGSSRGTAFPSMHVAASVAQSLTLWRGHRRAGLGLLTVTTLLALGAVYGSFHYGVDVIAGVLVGVAASWVARAESDRGLARHPEGSR